MTTYKSELKNLKELNKNYNKSLINRPTGIIGLLTFDPFHLMDVRDNIKRSEIRIINIVKEIKQNYTMLIDCVLGLISANLPRYIILWISDWYIERLSEYDKMIVINNIYNFHVNLRKTPIKSLIKS